MEWYHRLVSWVIKKRIHQIEFFMKYPIDVQQEWFHKLIQLGKKTEWGKKYGYDSIKTIADYKAQVPIQTYESLLPYIERVRQGEKKVLWPNEIKWFAKSSGTTAGKSKFIPVSKESLEDCHYKGGKDLLSIYFHSHPDSQIFNGKSLVMGGSSQVSEMEASTYYGDLSAIIIEHLPYWVNFVQTPAKSLSLDPDWESKIDKMAEITAKQNVTNISGVPSWNLILLNKILEKTGADNISEIWPNLELYAHGGVNFNCYQSQFEKLIPNKQMSYLETYNASEGFFGIQDKFDGGKEMLLMLDYGIFFEFMPLDQLHEEHPKTLQLDEVSCFQNYAIIITTNAGLWRYMIGDTVQFTSLNPFRIKVSGRTKYYINVFGEELIEDNVNEALALACKRTKSSLSEYMLAPIFPDDTGKGGHEWVIEFNQEPKDLSLFTEILDNALKQVNSDYEAKRFKNLALQVPKIHMVKKGSFFEWMKRQDKIGGQNKVPRLSMKRDDLEDFLLYV